MTTPTTPDPALEAAREINALLNRTHYVDIAGIIRRHYITLDYDAAIRASRSVQDEFDRLEQANAALRAENEMHGKFNHDLHQLKNDAIDKLMKAERDLAAALAALRARLESTDNLTTKPKE